MKVYLRDAGARHVAFRGRPVREVLDRYHVPAFYSALTGYNVRRDRAADAVAAFEEAGHRHSGRGSA